MKKIRELMKLRRADMARCAAAKIAMRDGFDADNDALYIVTTRTIESVVSSKQEVVN